ELLPGAVPVSPRAVPPRPPRHRPDAADLARARPLPRRRPQPGPGSLGERPARRAAARRQPLGRERRPRAGEPRADCISAPWAAGGLAVVPDDEYVGGAVAVGQVHQGPAVGAAVDVVHAVAALEGRPGDGVEAQGALEDLPVALDEGPEQAGGVAAVAVGVVGV